MTANFIILRPFVFPRKLAIIELPFKLHSHYLIVLKHSYCECSFAQTTIVLATDENTKTNYTF